MSTVRVEFFGRVQGVGFRYSVCTSCQAEGLSGWVRNRDDGSVEAVLQGDTAGIERALAALRRSRQRYIREVRTTPGVDADVLPGRFEIVH